MTLAPTGAAPVMQSYLLGHTPTVLGTRIPTLQLQSAVAPAVPYLHSSVARRAEAVLHAHVHV